MRSPSKAQVDRLQNQLESQEKHRNELEKEKQQAIQRQLDVEARIFGHERTQRDLKWTQETYENAREEWQKKERTYEKKQEASKIEIQELEAELAKSNQELRQLKR